MNKQQSSVTPDCGVHAKQCIERRGKRRLVKELLRRRLETRRVWVGLMATSAIAGALATVASLVQYGTTA